MNRRGLQVSDCELFIILEQPIEDPCRLLARHTIPLTEEFLDSTDPLPDADWWLVALDVVQSGLEVGGGAEMVGVGVGFQEMGDLVVVGDHMVEEGVGGDGGDGLGNGVIV